MKLGRTLAATTAAGILLAAVPTAAHADDDVYRTGNYTVRAGQTIDGDLTVRDGTVTIHGTVDGDVRQIGKGSVIVSRTGKVDGNITESGKGAVRIHGEVDGNVSENGKGHVFVYGTAEIDGDVTERKAGNLYVYRGADVEGDLSENGKGSLVRR